MPVPVLTGIPKVIVPIVAATVEEAGSRAASIAQNPSADWAELRLDCLPGREKEALQAVRAAMPGKPLLATLRTVREGQAQDSPLGPAEYTELCRSLMALELADLWDIEFSLPPDDIALLCRTAHRAGALALFSRHDFNGTPSVEEMTATLLAMADDGADIAKLAVMPHTPSDAAALLLATASARQQRPGTALLTMAMGPCGAVTRVCGGAFGSVATFGTAGQASAPGQPDAALLRKALSLQNEMGLL